MLLILIIPLHLISFGCETTPSQMLVLMAESFTASAVAVEDGY